MLKIGVISDTHGFLDPRVASIFKQVDHILHGGDIGTGVLPGLERIAPVTAVLGNTDVGLDFRETEVVTLAERTFLVHHIVDVRAPHDALAQRIAKETPDVVVFGHSHKPHHEQIGRVTYLNPGYAGKPRFDMPRTVAIAQCGENGLEVEFVRLQ